MNNKNINIRILIGQELGEIYLVVQQYVNNKWQHYPSNKYCGNYLVGKKIKEILKYNIEDVRKNDRNDLLKFKITNNIYVYINEYSILKNYSELKDLNKLIIKNLVYQKISDKTVLVKKVHKNISNSGVFKLAILSSISLGCVAISSYININNQKKQVDNDLKNISSFTVNNSYDFVSNNYETDDSNKFNEYSNIMRINTINALKNKAISDHKLNTDIFIEIPKLEETSNNNLEENNVLDKFCVKLSSMYFMDYDKVNKIYLDNKDEIDSSSNFELTYLLKVKDEFYRDDSISKESIVSSMSSFEKEKCIIEIAKNIYKVDDDETYALLLAIHRLETYYGTSDKCVYDNNPGGLRENGEFLNFKTFEIGAESFVRNTLKIRRQAIEKNGYDDIEYSMQTIYCEGENDWAYQVELLKNDILDSNQIEEYLSDAKTYVKKYK